ncbi:MAG TPA: lantibiotic dehydratase C-terminal domain-containing protein [Allosphingosinicella sp.]|nr:lantibiotic dehydratase C-terminal domain-containing protein [Allosphingosinicella sp.]
MSHWPALRINHHCPDHGELLRDAVAPLVAEVRAREGVRILVRPHWREGPHVLLAMDVDEERFDREIYPPCRERIQSWLQENPSRTGLDPAEYRRQVLLISDAEREPAGADRLAADNSVERSWYQRAAPYEITELGEVRDQFQVRTLDLALKLVARRLASRSRFMVELATWIAAAGLSGGEDFDFWPISMLAHSEVYLSHQQSLRKSFENLTAKLRPPLGQSWRDSGIGGANRLSFASGSPELQDWLAALESLNNELGRVIEGSQDLRESAAMFDSGGNPRPFLNWDSASLKALMNTKSHLRYRILINFVYGLFPLIGLKPVERAFLCYLIWQTIEACAPELIARADRAVRRAESEVRVA